MTTRYAPPQRKRWVCAHCGHFVGYWVSGWKHQLGGHGARPTCGRKLTGADVRPYQGNKP